MEVIAGLRRISLMMSYKKPHEIISKVISDVLFAAIDGRSSKLYSSQTDRNISIHIKYTWCLPTWRGGCVESK